MKKGLAPTATRYDRITFQQLKATNTSHNKPSIARDAPKLHAICVHYVYPDY